MNLETEVRENRALELSFPAGPGVRGSGWGPHPGTCFRSFLAEVGLGKEKRDKKVGWVSPGADGGGEVSQARPATHTTAGTLQPLLMSR